MNSSRHTFHHCHLRLPSDTAPAVRDERRCAVGLHARRGHLWPHHSASRRPSLTDGPTTDRVWVRHSRLPLPERHGALVPRPRAAPWSGHRITWTADVSVVRGTWRSSYPPVNDRRPSISSCRNTGLEQTSYECRHSAVFDRVQTVAENGTV
jgi:hypothetical protein